MINSTIKEIDNIREKLRISSQELAKASGFAVSYLSHARKGKCNLSIEFYGKIVNYFNDVIDEYKKLQKIDKDDFLKNIYDKKKCGKFINREDMFF